MSPFTKTFAIALTACALLATDQATADNDDLNEKPAAELLSEGSYRAAFDAYTTAIIADPQDFRALNNRAVALIGMRKFDAALTDLTDALRLQASSGTIWNNRANVNCALKRIDDAIADRMQAMQRGRFSAAAAQAGLRKSGYYSGPADGIWGYDSDEALLTWTKAGCPDAPKTRPL